MNSLIQSAVVGGELALAFADSTECYIPLERLRRACPCAACQGEPDAMGRVVRLDAAIGARGFELIRAEVVGGYALQMFWADGHSTGIYSFDLLKSLG